MGKRRPPKIRTFERRPNDHYPTEPWVTRTLLDTIDVPVGLIWEPACGAGDMARVLEERWPVIATDIVDYGYEPALVPADFLAFRRPFPGVRSIITNPPFSIIDAFMTQALRFVRHHRVDLVAFLAPLPLDAARGRRVFFAESPLFAEKIVLHRRPWWSDARDAHPRATFAWYVWRRPDGQRRPILTYAG